jgi:polyvinyl alcohol dehydrogenase (cytochrome)
MRSNSMVLMSACVVMFLAPVLQAQVQISGGHTLNGQKLFEQRCTTCHGNPNSAERAPDRGTLMKLTPEAVLSALTTGPMRVQAADLTDAQKRLIAEFLGGRRLGSRDAGDAKVMPNRCASNPPLPDPSAGPEWNGWGADLGNSRFQGGAEAGMSPDQVARLKLKWAFGFPYGVEAYGQPTVAAGRIFVGSDTSFVYSLDAATGCVYWSFTPDSGVRTAISIGPVNGQGARSYAVYFGDTRANVYALNASTGELLWKMQVEDHPLARITGAPTLYGGRLYVPVSSTEEATSISMLYPCCTFRGSVVALDAATGRQIWKSYTIPEKPRPTKKNSKGTQLWAPAGVAVWTAPTIDATRHLLYVGTGDSYTEPAAKTSDAVMAFDLDSGKVVWSFQDTKNDAWMAGCSPENPSENCPKVVGPDYDFGASPILRTLPSGRQVLVAAHKSGRVLGLDPDRRGAVLWKVDLSEKPPVYMGLISFGGAADEQNAYFALQNAHVAPNSADDGVAAVRLAGGERGWFEPLVPAEVPGEPGRPGQSAAVTCIPGVVFSGGWDGVLRALSTDDGHIIWKYNTVREFETVNGVPAKGGSMGAPGPTVAGGMLFVGSGYIGVKNGLPGNVLLAFSVE